MACLATADSRTLTTIMTDISELRGNIHRTDWHPESLLSVPLISQAFRDTAFRLVPRSTDVNWAYIHGPLMSVTGFNPFQFAYYYGQDSRFAAWLADPLKSARELNDNDRLVREALMMVHDYLHAWAYAAIDRLWPSLDVLHGEISSNNFEDYVFCHLLSEAVATVGLDYWYLCQHDVNEFCQIGSTVGPLTVHYREAHLAEYRRFCPELNVQTPQFFRTIATFYCTGEFPGFDADDMKHSPRLLTWLRHELSYGVTQRSLTRRWLDYLSHAPIAAAGADWEAPVAVANDLYQRLIDELGLLLWDKVKNGNAHTDVALPDRPATRCSPATKSPDFQFTNLARIPEGEWLRGARPASQDSFKYFLPQFLGLIPVAEFPTRLMRHIPLLQSQRDISLVIDLLGNLPRRGPLADEPRDLMIAL